MSTRPHPQPQRGSVSLMVAFLLPIFLGLAALAIDLVYLQIVRNEMQNDADAAALAGAGYFFDGTNGTPYWSLATQKAQVAVTTNTASGTALKTGTVATGYWNLVDTPKVLQALPMVPKAYDAPAIQVTVAKAVNTNDGEVPTYFARYWGILSRPMQATAVAGLASPDSILPGGVFPMVIAQCMYDTYWNFNTTPAGPKLDPATGKPYIFKIGSAYQYATCASGEWTSLLDDSNSTSDIRELIANGNPVELSIGQSIWIQTGAKAAVFGTVQNCSAAGNKKCEYVVIPTVTTVTSHARAPIKAFACLHILDANQGGKYIQAEMSTKCKAPWGTGIGPNYGVVSPPSLFR
jgi:Flp pilus assembly protein TadG